MKKVLSVLAATMLAGSLVACSAPSISEEKPTTSTQESSLSGSEDTSTSIENTTTAPAQEGEWEADVQEAMISVIGEVLPYIELNAGFSFGTSDEVFEDGVCFYIEEDGEEDKCTVYGDILIAADYEYSYVDDTYGYDSFYYVKYTSETTGILVNVEFFPGGSADGVDYSSGMSIYSLPVTL